MNAPTYPKYKPSGISWLGDVPEHWAVQRLKFLGEALIGITYSPDEVTTEGQGILVLRSSNVQNGKLAFNDNVYVAKQVQERDYTQEGDILICARNGSAELVGKCALIDSDNAGHTFGAFMSVVRSDNGFFLYYYFCSDVFKSQTGLFKTSTINQLTSSTLNSLLVTVPAPDERDAIAKFLDRKTGQIDELIGKKKELIAKLTEQRSALITAAVTGKHQSEIGNPHSPMCDSGIAWLGKVPKHWVVKKLKYPFRFSKGKDAQKYTAIYVADNPGSYPVYSGQTKDDGIMGRINTYDYDVDEVLFVTTVGAKAMTPTILHGKFSLSQNCLLMFPEHERIDLRYFHYQLFPIFFAERGSIASQMQDSLRVSDFDKFYAAYPPINEQRVIADFLDEKAGKIDGLIQKTETAIQTLEEYRTALITAAVTGKIDVRGITT